MNKYTFNIFGSQTSIDYDFMVFVDNLSTNEENKIKCKEIQEYYQKYFSNGKVNVNLAVLSNGKIINVHKGYPEECNNSVYNTYHLHCQFYPKMVTEEYNLELKHVYLKVARALRHVLSFLSRTEFKDEVKKSLKSNAKQKIDCLKNIPIHQITDLNKNNHDLTEFYKILAFQICQSLSFIYKNEIYTKEQACVFNSELSVFIERKTPNSIDLFNLNYIKNNWLDVIEQNLDVEKINEI